MMYGVDKIRLFVVISIIAFGAVYGHAQKSYTKSRTTSGVKIPKDAVRGDFDGDGKSEYIWITPKFDSEGYVVGPTVLKSNNPKLNGLKLTATRGFILLNLGKLDSTGRDFVGIVPSYDSTWTQFYTYVFRNGKWVQPIAPFSYWESSNYDGPRVIRGRQKGRLGIFYDDMSDDDFNYKYKEVPVKF